MAEEAAVANERDVDTATAVVASREAEETVAGEAEASKRGANMSEE